MTERQLINFLNVDEWKIRIQDHFIFLNELILIPHCRPRSPSMLYARRTAPWTISKRSHGSATQHIPQIGIAWVFEMTYQEIKKSQPQESETNWAPHSVMFRNVCNFRNWRIILMISHLKCHILHQRSVHVSLKTETCFPSRPTRVDQVNGRNELLFSLSLCLHAELPKKTC